MNTLLTVSESGETGSIDLNFAQGTPGTVEHMPFTLHIFGASEVRKWNEADEESRQHTLSELLIRLTLLNLAGYSDEAAVILYNTSAAAQGIDTHAVAYTPGI